MIDRRHFLASAAASPFACTGLATADSAGASEPVGQGGAVGPGGVWTWSSGAEVAVFGVNYDLPSASAFRFAKASGMPFETIVEADFAHFRRMGFNGLRLCFWGDWENSTAEGAFVENEHSDVLDLIVKRAGEEGFACLFSPFVTYDASWPDSMARPRAGIAHAFKKEDLGRDPRAIAAQARYLREILQRRNPLTGRRYADEPALAAVELINEPTHHSADRALSVRYINTLAKAVRSTGYDRPLFHNVSQDMKIAAAIAASEVQGATFAWYPTGLQNGHAVEGNGLLLVERYEEFKAPELKDSAKLVYEFDAPDTLASYFYPAMVRGFREGGAQLAMMFAYDSLPISRSNSEFNDHFLNLVATPAKAISALIAATAMKELPRGRSVAEGRFRERFGPVRVDDLADLSELVDASRYFHSNDTSTPPPRPDDLKQLAGVGSSPLVTYDGAGAWFLDKRGKGVWRLEVHPDAATVANPFGFRRPERPAVRIVHRARRMRIALPDLGTGFLVRDKDGHEIEATAGQFEVRPGVYLLARGATKAAIDYTFFTLPGEQFAPIVQHEVPASRVAGRSWTVTADIVAPDAPKSVMLHIRKGGNRFEHIQMRAAPRFRYAAVIPAELMVEGQLSYSISVEQPDGTVYDAHVEGTRPGEWDYPRAAGYRVPVVAANAPLVLLDAERHGDRLIVPYGGYSEHASINVAPASDGDPAIRIMASGLADAQEGDLPAQRSWNGKIDDEGRALSSFSALEVVAGSATSEPLTALVLLIERDGMAWGAPVRLSGAMRTVRIALENLRPMDAAMLPCDFPVGINPYFLRRPSGRGASGDRIQLEDLQGVQVTVRRASGNAGTAPTAVAEIRRVSLAA